MSNRINFQREHGKGLIVNIESGEDPVGFPPETTVHVDLDGWRHPFSVQADAHHLPFKDNAFDTAVLGDILEHAVDPLKMVVEAGRVAKRVVLTIFEEWRLGGPGQHIDRGIEQTSEELRRQGYRDLDHYKRTYEPLKEKFLRGLPESRLPHSFHINQFTDENIKKLVEASGMRCLILTKKPEATHEGHTWQNWLILLEKVN
jgi:hypothetical protein